MTWSSRASVRGSVGPQDSGPAWPQDSGRVGPQASGPVGPPKLVQPGCPVRRLTVAHSLDGSLDGLYSMKQNNSYVIVCDCSSMIVDLAA